MSSAATVAASASPPQQAPKESALPSVLLSDGARDPDARVPLVGDEQICHISVLPTPPTDDLMSKVRPRCLHILPHTVACHVSGDVPLNPTKAERTLGPLYRSEKS